MTIPDDEDDTMIILSPEMLSTDGESESCDSGAKEKRYSKLFDDMFYRPSELEGMCLWDVLRNYVKEKKPKSKTHRNTYLNFKPGHSQYTTHYLKKLDNPVIPVIQVYRVPRNALDNDKLKHAVVILALFRPWSNIKDSPLKSPDVSWSDAMSEFEISMRPDHVRVTSNRLN
jgi:hypothetical protein